MADTSGSIPKLYYFNFRGRAEVVRLVMAAGGMKFEDCRFSGPEWPNYKANAPFGQCPYMEVEGKCYAQTVALATYAARECGLYGKSNLDQLGIDQVMMLIQDLVGIVATFYNEKDKEKWMEHANNFKAEVLPRFFGYFEKTLKDNGTGYTVGGTLSLADIAIYELITSAENNALIKDYLVSLDDFPTVKTLVEKVSCNKGIRAYEESRPDSGQ